MDKPHIFKQKNGEQVFAVATKKRTTKEEKVHQQWDKKR